MSELLVSEETLRKMPFSMEAEQSVLGSIIIDPEKCDNCGECVDVCPVGAIYED